MNTTTTISPHMPWFRQHKGPVAEYLMQKLLGESLEEIEANLKLLVL